MESSGQLVEREREIAVLEDLLDDSARAVGRFAIVEAAAGLGKTALLALVKDVAERRGIRVLSARASELERDYPFALVRQLLEPVVASAAPAERQRLLAGAAGLAEPIVLGPSGGEPDPDGREDPGYAALHGLYWLLVNILGDEPLVLVIDDLHWGDAASLRFLAFLETRIEGMPLLAACARRPDEPGTEHDLLRRIGGGPAAVRIHPGPLSQEGAEKLLASALGPALTPELAAACHSACAGNPFYLEVLGRELSEADGDGPADHVRRVPSIAPSAVRRAILLRVGRLSAEATELAKAAAVLGDEARLEDAAELASLGERRAQEAATALAQVSLLKRERRLTFAHPIARTAVYEEIPPPERADAHRRAAGVLSARGAASDRVASHLMRAPPAADGSVVDELRNAARQALANGAAEAAAAYLRRALAEPPARELLPLLLRELGRAELAAAEASAAERFQAAIDADDDPVTRGEAALELGPALGISGRLSEAAEALEAAAAETRAAAPELSARLAIEAANTRRLLGQGPAEGLEAIADRVPAGSPVERSLLASAAIEANLRGEPTAALAEQALAGGMLRREHGTHSQAFVTLANMLTVSDRFERAGEVIEDAMRLARSSGSVAGFATMSGCRSTLNRRLGALAEAEADARAALDAAQSGAFQLLEPMWLAQLVEAQTELGKTAEGSEELERRDLTGPLVSPNLGFLLLLCARGQLRTAAGAPADGLADLEACGQALGRVVNTALFPWRSRAALALLALGERARAGELAAEELDLARRSAVPSAIALALRAQGLVAGGEAGVELLRQALQQLEPLRPTIERAHVLVDLGATLRRAGHRSDARPPLREGLDLAQHFGAAPLAGRARAELEAAGAPVRAPHQTGLEALTASERRVATMAGGGMTNAEIAQALFVTLRTVETHLTNGYRKLGISGRPELERLLNADAPG